ncbi:MAG: hypothetical protein HN855_13350 [Anaerolineae bacterium]|jgi:hypothetical protein|nr:hypothetical protein [Anaerolineae bacterium]MBT7071460.1 hypothetical protein [Anaerolineae bacterium]MBT7326140.1 hypothetical protein [Anaerolineae bacterium]
MRSKRFLYLILVLALSLGACNVPDNSEALTPITKPEDTQADQIEEPIEPTPYSEEVRTSSNIITSGEVEILNLESFDFVTGEKGIQTGGDLYIRTADTSDCGSAEIWANIPPQGGGLFLFSGMNGDLSTIDPASMGLRDADFSPFCVELLVDGVYLYKRNVSPGDYVIFRVINLLPEAVSLSYIVINAKLPEAESIIVQQEVGTPDSFTLPAGQSIPVYDSPNSESSGTFEVELFFTIIEERDGFLNVSWDASNGSTYDAWIKKDDVAVFMAEDFSLCPFIFTLTNYTPKVFPAPDGSQPKGVFAFDALVDLSSEPVTIEQTEATFQDASNILFNLTGFTIQLNNFGTVKFTQEQPPEYYMRDSIPECYIDQKTDAEIPDSLLIFSYGSDNYARTMGGFTYTIEGSSTFKNHFVDAFGDENLVYVMFNHYSHKYARCGYDETGETIISDVSVGGECRNQPGTACVMNNGYSMCATAVNDLYASTPNYFSASTVIHEIMHSFGLHGNMDHYGTQNCTDEMKKLNNSWEAVDNDAEIYNVMCPYVYDNFANGYRP